MKICIIGYSGSGKSTLAIELGEIFHLPVLHIDNVSFYDNWQERSSKERNKMILDFMKQNQKGWIIDGNYYNHAHLRFEECDCIYFLDFNCFYCFKEAFIRYFKNKIQLENHVHV